MTHIDTSLDCPNCGAEAGSTMSAIEFISTITLADGTTRDQYYCAECGEVYTPGRDDNYLDGLTEHMLYRELRAWFVESQKGWQEHTT